jgi:hypothetical protein
MICAELSQMPSPEPDSPQVDDIPLEFTIEPLAFPGLAGAHDGTAIPPDREDVELEDQRVMEVLVSECIILNPRQFDPDWNFYPIILEFRNKWGLP